MVLERKLLETVDKPSKFILIMIKLGKMEFGPVKERNAYMHGKETWPQQTTDVINGKRNI